jgi:FdhD protein
MKEETERFPILKVTEQATSRIEGTVVREFSLTIFLHNQELVTLLCSPTDLKYLVAGFLVSEGLIEGKGDIKDILVDDQKGMVRVKTQGDKGVSGEISFKRLIGSSGGRGGSLYSAPGAKGKAKVESDIHISRHKVFALMDEFVQRSRLYKTTGGVHSAALCDTIGILVFAEDIGRHNAIDKVFGQCLLQDIPTHDRIILTSGRVSSEILLKVAKRNIPIIISKSAPTNLAVRLSDDFNITLIGFVRGKRMNAYTNDWRIVIDGE